MNRATWLVRGALKSRYHHRGWAVANELFLAENIDCHSHTTNAGSITNSPTTTPGTYVVAVGRAIAPNTLDIEIQLPILLSGNTTSGGLSTLEAIFDSDVATGQVVFVSDSGHVDLAVANAAPDAIGFALDDVSAGSTGPYITQGQIEIANLIAGDCYFLSPDNAGKITNIPPYDPGTYVVSLGRAVSTDTLDIEIQPPILSTGNTALGSSQTTEVFTISATQAASGEIVLAESPSEISAFLNGLLITDYSINGSIIEFDCLAEGDFLVVKY